MSFLPMNNRPAGGLLGTFSPRQQGLLALAGSLLEAGGPSYTPTSLGQGLGRGLQAMQQAEMAGQQAHLQQRLGNAQLAQLEQQANAQRQAQERWDALNRPRPGAPGTQTAGPSQAAAATTPIMEMGFTPQQVAALDAMDPASRDKVLQERVFAAPGQRRIVEDATGRKRYTDSGDLVFPGVEVAPNATKPFAAVDREVGREVLITPEQYAAAPDRYTPRPQQPMLAMPRTPPTGYFYETNAEGTQTLKRIPGFAYTEGQSSSAKFADMMTQAEGVIKGLTDAGFDPTSGIERLASRAPGGRYAVSDEFRSYQQAQEQWVRAKLRKESGAAIGDQEMADEIKTFFPQPGDSATQVVQKRRARARATRSMIKQSQGAYEEFYGGERSAQQDAPRSAEDVVAEALNAILSGADLAAVMQRMVDAGYDPRLLDQ